MRRRRRTRGDYKGVSGGPARPETLQIGKALAELVVGAAGDGDHLEAGLAAAVEADGGFRHAEGFGEQPDQGGVGLAFDRPGADANLEDRTVVGVDVPAVDAIGGGAGGEADGETGGFVQAARAL